MKTWKYILRIGFKSRYDGNVTIIRKFNKSMFYQEFLKNMHPRPFVEKDSRGS